MADTIQNLWPTDFPKTDVLTPVAILRQQGAALGERTKNIVVGRVVTMPSENGFAHTFKLYCSPLGYSRDLFVVQHDDEPLYPVKIKYLPEPAAKGFKTLTADTPEEFSERLREIFTKDKTKNIVASLLAQSTQ